MRARDPLRRVRDMVAARERAGLRRTLAPRQVHDDAIDLAGNDYLGLTRDPHVVAAAAVAARTWGAGSTGSRLVTGTTQLHETLEDELAAFTEAPAALVFSSGYLANLGVLSALGGPEVTIVSLAGNHASIVDGCRLARSPVEIIDNDDLDRLPFVLANVATPHSLVVTDAVFSVDGNLAPIAAIHDICRQHAALLVVDEAHGLGVIGTGAGAVVDAGRSGAPDIVRTATLSKSLGAQGGAVVGAREVIDLLSSTARPFIFDTGLAPSSAGAALAALRILAADPGLAARVRANAYTLATLLGDLSTGRPDAAVVPVVLGDPNRAVAAAARCLELGVRVGCFRPPSVPIGRSCLRLTARADLSAAQLSHAATVVASAVEEAIKWAS